MSLQRVWIPSPNFSSRSGAKVRLIVIHTAEGARTYRELGAYFQKPVDASSHVGADDTPDTVGEYVKRTDKAWTCAQYNSVSVNIELCAFADWSTDTWMQHPRMLANCAAWISEESAHYGIPITRLTAAQAQGTSYGVCGHVDLGPGGGGHHDPGSGFPWEYVLDMARSGGPPKQEDQVAIAAAQNAQGGLHVFVEAKDGSVWYTWQNKGENSWAGGKAGQQVAGLSKLAPAPKT